MSHNNTHAYNYIHAQLGQLIYYTIYNKIQIYIYIYYASLYIISISTINYNFVPSK